MNLIYYHAKDQATLKAREYMFSLMSLFCITVLFSIKQGAHMRCLLSLWRFEIGFEIHNWRVNIVSFKENEEGSFTEKGGMI